VAYALALLARRLLPWESGHRREFFRNFLLQVYFTFVQAAPMIAFTGFFAGGVFAFQSNAGLALVGTAGQLGKVLVFVVFRELSPLTASVIMVARSVTAIAAEMATIKVQKETEALTIMGISIGHYLVYPRVVGGIVSGAAMAAWFWVAALFGGWLGANYAQPYPLDAYLNAIAEAMRVADFPVFLLKTAMIGGVVTNIAVKRGLSADGAPYEVPIVTNRAVVEALTSALLLHALVAGAFYLIFGVDL
jgi:phospholipid/cholesterol/gamma-HCH transport system permease protein